ncbi:hypothetical protein Cob_v003011 [Colletotrichum orbiculare MAFF 240422]|uniref:Uncharacterized protein n=1 Tax=Colletotrichum orbiculare (strain 104-T / ATCC 96160 / CBS 514.97 / LARS 414 / MAFF 240422) TaxID=1213857 RepID=N4VW72_COLOR|nr:hypothetical protein Cob_v003011 [Colletotrichum orbiculare MAFF 240422]
MKFSTLLPAVAAATLGTITTAAASPARRETPPLPDADYCCCDLARPGYVCKVPAALGGAAPDPVCNKALCPFDPQTEKQCCCCQQPASSPTSPWTVRCSVVPRGRACACPAVWCPFNYGERFLPVSPAE